MLLQTFSKDEQNRLYDQFINEESLFQEICDDLYVSPPSGNIKKRTTFVENWVDAKEFIIKLFTSKRPEKKVSFTIDALLDDKISYISRRRDHMSTAVGVTIRLNNGEVWLEYASIIKCIFAIAYSQFMLTNDTVWKAIIDALIDVLETRAFDLYGIGIEELFEVIDDGIANERIRQDYDYLQKKHESVSNNTEKEKDIEEANSLEDIDLSQKIIMSIMIKALESSGADFKKRGNVTNGAALINACTKIQVQTCKNFLSDRKLPYNHHANEIDKTNRLLKELGISWQL